MVSWTPDASGGDRHAPGKRPGRVGERGGAGTPNLMRRRPGPGSEGAPRAASARAYGGASRKRGGGRPAHGAVASRGHHVTRRVSDFLSFPGVKVSRVRGLRATRRTRAERLADHDETGRRTTDARPRVMSAEHCMRAPAPRRPTAHPAAPTRGAGGRRPEPGEDAAEEAGAEARCRRRRSGADAGDGEPESGDGEAREGTQEEGRGAGPEGGTRRREKEPEKPDERRRGGKGGDREGEVGGGARMGREWGGRGAGRRSTEPKMGAMGRGEGWGGGGSGGGPGEGRGGRVRGEVGARGGWGGGGCGA